MFTRIIALLGVSVVFSTNCFAADKFWVPSASVTCATFSANIKYPSNMESSATDSALRRFWQDAPLDKFKRELIAYLNAASPEKAATDPDSHSAAVTAMVNLDMYCLGHPNIMLRQVQAAEVIGSLKQSNTRSDPNQAAENWYQNTIGACGADSECARIANSYRNHAKSCNGGDQQACTDVARDQKDWAAKYSTPTAAVNDAMLQCLQAALRRTVDVCRENKCPPESLSRSVRMMQQANCGYSAIDSDTPTAPIYQAPNLMSSSCVTKPRIGGGFTTECTQY